MDLSLRSSTIAPRNNAPLIRPIPRLPWTITWYQSVWPQQSTHLPFSTPYASSPLKLRASEEAGGLEADLNTSVDNDDGTKHDAYYKREDSGSTFLATVFDVACCDGPVMFERVSNPNFALTVEHKPTFEPLFNRSEETRQVTMKTYICIYCNQSFKSLFCYQKHKKRHLNPVSVDITGTHNPPTRHPSASSKAKTRDLNVQFFPCKKCGCKFPSYYFVHKHRKTCQSA